MTEKSNYKKDNYKKIVAVSEGTKKEIIENYNVPPEDIVVIPNGIDLEEFSPENKEKYHNEIREKYNIDKDDIVLLFVGYDFKRKGLEFIIKAMSKLDNKKVKLIVVGRDNPAPYQKLANELNIIDKIIFTGHQGKVKKFYSASDIFVFPTSYEAFSHVSLEAVASGLPLLTTKINGTEELLRNGIEGFFIERNPDDIANKLKILINDKELRQKMGENARKRAMDFSWDIITKKYEELYKEIYILKQK